MGDPGAESDGGRGAAIIFLTASALFFGGSWPAAKVAVAAVPPMTLATARFIIALALLWAWTRAKRAFAPPLRVSDLPLVLTMGLTAFAGFNVLYLNGLRMAPALDGAIIVPGSGPVLTALLAWPMLRERLRGAGILGLVVALAGLVLVMRPGGAQTAGRLLGDVLFLLSALCWAIYSVVGKTAMVRFTPVSATFYGQAAGLVVLLPFAVAERGWTQLQTAPPSAWAGLVYLAVFVTVLAFVFFYEGLSRIGAIRASAFALLIPVFGVLLSVLFLGERLTMLTAAGGVFVLLGLWLVQHKAELPPPDSASVRDLGSAR